MEETQSVIQALATAADAARLAASVASEAAKVNTATTVAIAEIKVSMNFFSTQLDKILDAQKEFVRRAEFEESKKDFNKSVSDIHKGFAQHNLDDKDSFGKIDKKQDKLQNIVLLCMGGLAVIIFFIQYIIPLIINWKH